jgi:hypothetical protein
MINHVALVSETADLPKDDLYDVAAALQKQVTRDFGPIWNIRATVDPFASLERVPEGYWRVILMSDVPADHLGFHLDRDGQPFALVPLSEDWPRLASHEILELLADPFGNRLVASSSIHPNQGRVEYLVSICDPSGDEEFGYFVNGRWLSDFYTPRYFDPVVAAGVRYGFTDHLSEPREVLAGGHLIWRVPETQQWWLARHDGARMYFKMLPKLRHGACLREAINRQAPPPRPRHSRTASRRRDMFKNARDHSASARAARAEQLREQIQEWRCKK